MKSQKKQKGAGSRTNIISVAVVLLLAAAAIYAYNSFNSDKPIQGLSTEDDLSELSDNSTFEPLRQIATRQENVNVDKMIFDPNEAKYYL